MQGIRDFYERRAEMYDLAFDWDVEEEVAWLVNRLGDPRSVLEPGCGSGRMLVRLAERGVRVAGLDLSAPLLDIARERLRAVASGDPGLHRLDMRDFDLSERFDAAICPVSSFGYLPDRAAALAHLRSVARHLVGGGRYLVQLDLRCLTPYAPSTSGRSSWERDTPQGRLRTSWYAEAFDPHTRAETQVTRFEWTTGSRRGDVIEDTHEMRLWSWCDWAELIGTSPLRLVGAFDGSAPGCPRVALGRELEERPLTWFELVR